MRDGIPVELTRVTGTLVTMAQAVRHTMRDAGTALITADATLAQQTVERERELDVLYRVTEDRLYAVVDGDRPVGGDLRTILTVLQIAAGLNRMGDLAAHVAEAVLRRQPTSAVAPELAGLFRAMGVVADELSATIIVALTAQDAAAAARLDRDDDAMDDLHARLFASMLSPEWPLGVEAAVDGALLGRYYERYADNAVNVGRHLVHLITGAPAEPA